MIYDDGKIRTLEISCENGMIWILKIAVGLYDKHFINTKKPQKIKDRLYILHEDVEVGAGLLIRFDVDGKRDLSFFVHRQY